MTISRLKPRGIQRKPMQRKGSKIVSKRKITRKGIRTSTGTKVAPKARNKPWKLTKSALAKIDAKLSKQILKRDKHCQFPNCQNTAKLTCSHFIGRAVKSTRFDEENCVALCLFHHFFSKDLGFEFQKQTKEKHGYDGQYTKFMKKRLGRARYAALIERASTSIKLKAAIENYLTSLQ